MGNSGSQSGPSVALLTDDNNRSANRKEKTIYMMRHVSLSNLCAIFVVAVFAICFASIAHADQFTFNVDNCSGGCLALTTPPGNGGTVTLNDHHDDMTIPLGVVQFDILLNSPLFFHDTNGLMPFAFNSNLTHTPTEALLLTDLSAITTGFTFHDAGVSEDNGKTFNYYFTCVTGTGNICNSGSNQNELKFTITHTGVTDSTFEVASADGAKIDFAANVTPGAGSNCTGLIGAGSGTSQSTSSQGNHSTTTSDCSTSSTTPEPTSIAFFGSGLLGVGFVLRKKFGARS